MTAELRATLPYRCADRSYPNHSDCEASEQSIGPFKYEGGKTCKEAEERKNTERAAKDAEQKNTRAAAEFVSPLNP